MDKALLDRNAKHIYQASQTPFAQAPLKDIVPSIKSFPEISQKIFCSNHSNFITQTNIINEQLASLEMIPLLQQLESFISNEAFKQEIQEISEGKSSSKSGQHYSMYKVMLAFSFRIQIMVRTINICVQNSIILHQWKKIFN